MADEIVDTGAMRKGGGAVADVSQEFLRATKSHLEQVGDLTQLGRNDLLAAALQLVYGSVITVANSVVDSHSQNMDAQGQFLDGAAQAFDRAEDSNVAMAAALKKGIG